jgi:glycerate kinase
MHILIAPNAFKNSLDASAAAEAIERGLQQSGLSFTSQRCPVGDGGDGTAVLLNAKLGGTLIHADVHDPLGRRIQSSFGWIEQTKTAIIELADASGLKLLKPEEYNPLRATTHGCGELIKIALDRSATQIILGIGGSATIDAGIGILSVLGIRFLDSRENDLVNLPHQLDDLDSIDNGHLDTRILNTRLTVMCDVENYLLGKQGAAHVFGPQKGASIEAINCLESGLEHFSRVTEQLKGLDMRVILRGGAAGGVAAGLAVFCNARLVSGIDYFLDSTEFNVALKTADLVITGEGSIDDQTLQGKAPFGVAKMAKEQGVPVIALAGQIPDHPGRELKNYFGEILSINPQPGNWQEAIKNTAINLERTAKLIGERLNGTKLSEFN